MPSTTFKSYRRRLLAILVGLGLWAFAGWAFIAGGTQQLAAGADLTARDRHGDTALHTAVNWQRIEALRLLIAHGAPEDGPLRHTLEYGASVEATAYSPDGAPGLRGQATTRRGPAHHVVGYVHLAPDRAGQVPIEVHRSICTMSAGNIGSKGR